VLCALFASSALASFWDVQRQDWSGYTDHFCGDTLVATGTLTNSGSIIFNTSTLPASTGPMAWWDTAFGDYWYGVGVLADGDTGITINNNSGGIMQGVVTGSGQAYAVGVYTMQNVNAINNWGTIDAQLQNHDGYAYAARGSGNITNNAGATCSATGTFYAAGVSGFCGNVVNNGTIKVIATGGTEGDTANQANVNGVEGGAPICFENNGLIIAGCTGGATNRSRGVNIWGEGGVISFKNTGVITTFVSDSAVDVQDNGVYFGDDNYDLHFYNSGTISVHTDYALGLENDSPYGNLYVYNSGMIETETGAFALMLGQYCSGPYYNRCYFTNTGTFKGQWFSCVFQGGVDLYDSGDIHTGTFWMGGGDDNVYISGLPTISPTIDGSGGSNNLVFNLTGTLQYVNGNTASGTNLSAFNLVPSSSIVVSGKTYSWNNFTNVSGTVIPGAPPLAGPTGLTATAASITQAELAWNVVAGATNYNIKRSTSGGPYYTTIASGVVATNFTDTAAFIGVPYYYVVSAMVGGSETSNSAEVALRHPKLTGTIIGTAGSWDNLGNTITNVFDNDLTTFFDAPDPGNGDWVGLDFGAGVSNVIALINYCPRSGFESRMVGGIFQGANQANFSGAVTLFTVTSQPPAGVFTSVNITNASAFRYVRYLAPSSSWGNVAELEFYDVVPAPGGLAATTVSSGQINLTWDFVANAASYNVKRSTTNGGPYTIIATGVNATNYTDTGLSGATTYYYVVSGVSDGSESANGVQASATTMASAPAGLTATAASANQISLAWNVVTNATSYNVKRSTINGGPYTTIASGVTVTNYLDSGLVSGATYFYVVSAVFGGDESPDSAQASATPIPATAVFWTGAVNGTWDTSTANWRSNGAPAVFANGAAAVFDDTASGNTTVSLSATRTPALVIVNNSSLAYSIGGSAIAGTGSLTKSGSGTLTLSSANSYSGGTTLNAGTLEISNGGTLLGTELGGGAVTNNGGTIYFYSGGSSTPVSYAPGFVLNGGTISSEDGFQRLATGAGATITVNAPTMLQREWGHLTGKYLSLDGQLKGSGALTLQGFAGNSGEGSTIWINNNGNTYNGVVTVNANSGSSGCFALGVGANNALRFATVILSGTPSGGDPNFTGSGIVFGAGMDAPVFGGLSGNGNFALADVSSTPVALTVGGNNGSTTFSGVLSGSGSLTKSGSGTLTLSGANTYSGGAAVNGGALVFSTVSLAKGNYTVANGATMGVTNASSSSALVSNLTVAAGASLEFRRVASTTTPLIVASNIAVNGGCAVKITVAGGLAAGSSYPLARYAGTPNGFANLQLQMPYGRRGALANNAGQIVLANVAVVATNAPTIGCGMTNSQLYVDWPADHTGWRLQAQTNSLGANWVDVPGNWAITDQWFAPVSPGNGSVFYRLVYP
jgi:autotransporter-associated beta strand protein